MRKVRRPKSEVELLREWTEWSLVAKDAYLATLLRLSPEERTKDRGASFGSIQEVFTHILDVYLWWFESVPLDRQKDNESHAGRALSPTELRSLNRRVNRAARALLAGRHPGPARAPVRHRRDRRGRPALPGDPRARRHRLAHARGGAPAPGRAERPPLADGRRPAHLRVVARVTRRGARRARRPGVRSGPDVSGGGPGRSGDDRFVLGGRPRRETRDDPRGKDGLPAHRALQEERTLPGGEAGVLAVEVDLQACAGRVLPRATGQRKTSLSAPNRAHPHPRTWHGIGVARSRGRAK